MFLTRRLVALALAGFELLVGSTLAAPAKAPDCCETLRKSLPDIVSWSNTSAFTDSLSAYWVQQESLAPPECIVSVQSVAHVQTTVRVLARLNAKSNTCPFAIRAGGHGNYGASNQASGVDIDLRGLNRITVDQGLAVASIGAGASWGKVALELDTLGLVAPGGRDGDVGVGGLSLAGGISYVAPLVGFTADNIVKYQVVKASGDVITVSATSNADLFKALKGGLNNFGIVTRIDIKTLPLSRTWGGTTYYDISTAPQQLNAFYNFTSDPSYDDKAYAYQSFGYTPGSTVVLNNLAYAGAPATLPAKLSVLNAAAPALFSTLRLDNQTAFTTEQAVASPKGLRQIHYTTTFQLNKEILTASFEIWNASLARIKSVPNLTYSWTFEPLPAPLLAASAKGGNVLGLPSGGKPLVLGLIRASYVDAADDTYLNDIVKQVFSDIEARAEKLGVANQWKYAGYAGKGQPVIEGYGKSNVAFLEKVSSKYDPEQLFQRSVPGGFKL
ncbi:FAD binding domain-containing protein [Karstenula rhodostoma CBS 690.94]|uniref:FAD binding domain-containing protein n=1 Tax=Karstenula rhodostoma CBS 690.94 TaxID=1392251 RepID=A0A9P4PQ42_9PLEO|nr:FAD binding domain-containing protein [Karstenula rhodostoma CBS 690.94]